jgi:glycosyltransferase involved in cell wall biosynthesis
MRERAGIPVENGLWPRITLVTVCVGEDEQIRDTVRSVVGQFYPNLEYIVVATAASPDTRLLREFEGRFCWLQCPGAADANEALNAAFAKSSGEIRDCLRLAA